MEWLSQILSSLSRPFKWWIVVAPWEGALRIRLGKVADELGPGPHFRIPFFDRVYIQSLRLRLVSDTGQTMTTQDGKVVTISIGIEYGIANLLQVYEALANPESVLIYRTQGIIADHVHNTDSDALSPSTIKAVVLASLPVSEWGMDRLHIHVTSFAFVKTYRLMMNDYRSYTNANEAIESGASQ